MNLTASNGTSNEDILLLSIPFSINLVVGLPITTYVLWLMVKGGRESLATDFFALQMTVGEFLNFSLCLVYALYALFSFNDKDFNIDNLTLNLIMGFTLGLVYGSRPVFQCLMCLERYLAIMKPVVFQKYRPLRYKVASASLAWLLVLAYCGSCLYMFVIRSIFYTSFVLFVAFLLVKLFCGLAVLGALKNPGPGDGNRQREGTNVKMRAFKTILLSLCATMLSDIPMMTFMVWDYVSIGEYNTVTVFMVIYACVAVTGYVQPCLYLHRMGKLPCTKP